MALISNGLAVSSALPISEANVTNLTTDLTTLTTAVAARPILLATPTLTAAQIKSTRVAAPTLIAAPGANLALQVISGSVRLIFGTAAYVTGGNDLDLIYAGNEAAEDQQWGYVAPALGEAVVSSIANLNNVSSHGFGNDPTINAVTAVSNKAIVAHTENADWTTGDGVLKFDLFYRVVPLT